MNPLRLPAFGLTLLLFAAVSAPPSFTGIWEARLDFGPTTRGLLTVVRRPDAWSASIAGRSARFRPLSGRIVFRLSDGSAEFTGQFSRDGSISGFWTQSAGVTLQPYMFPLHLRRIASHEWTGDVVPLATRRHTTSPCSRGTTDHWALSSVTPTGMMAS
jgi:hypothetical protein